MNTWMATLGAVAAVYLIALLGFWFRRSGRLGPEADQGLLDLTVRVFMPALILDTLLGNARLAQAGSLVVPPLLGFATVLLGIAVAFAAVRLLGPLPGLTTVNQRRTFVVSCSLYNYGYVAIPLVRLLFDPTTLGVLFVFNLGVETSLWTACVLVLTGGFERGWWKRALSPPTLAVLGSLAANALGLGGTLPAFAATILRMLGECAIPVGLLLVGATAADHLGEGAWSQGRRATIAANVLRMGILPLLFQLAAVSLPLSIELRRVLVVQAAMPSAMFTIVMARYFGGHPLTAVRIVLSTALVSLVTIPLWVALGLRLIR